MRKGILTVLLLVITATVFGQVYTRLNLGVKFPAGQQTVIADQRSSEWTNVNWSFGGGLVPQLGVGCKLNQWLDAELNLSYLFSNNLTWQSQDSATVHTFSEHARGFLISPQVVLNSPEICTRLQPFGRFGFTISPGTTIRQQDDAVAPNMVKRIVNEYKTRVALGCQASIGCHIELSRSLVLDAGLEGMILTPALKSGRITEYTVNGTDLLPTFDPAYVSWKFADSKPVNATNNDRLTAKRPYSSVGFVVGMRYSWPAPWK